MAEVKRYTASIMHPGVREDPEGLLVAYHHYAELKAQVEELELEVFAFDRTIKQASCHYDNRLEDIRQLQAQVERLTKAVMHSPAAQLKLKELEGKTTFEEINSDNQ
jgi:hypothetical protein